MAQPRRDFIKNIAAMGIYAPIAQSSFMQATFPSPTFEELKNAAGNDKDFWRMVQQCYSQSPEFINLENGYFSPQPLPVLNYYIEKTYAVNLQPSFYMRRKQEEDKENIRKELAAFAGVNPEELALLRNTTEGMNCIIQGLPMQKGDEAIMTNQDYGSMLEAFAYRAKREGIVNRIIDLPFHPQSDEEIVAAYERAITPKTRIIQVTHMINTTGQVLPVQKICRMAHSKGVEVVVDGAHTFAHLDFKIPDLECDYFAASLHKWLCNPLGTGILWVKSGKLEKIQPLFGDVSYPATNIRKLEHFGTHNVAAQLTLQAAIGFHNIIGSARKQERLRYLKNYWVHKVKNIEKVEINTPLQEERTGGIANFGIKGLKPVEIATRLYDDYKIFTVGIEQAPVFGVRVTPHLYTTEAHLDTLVTAIQEIAG